MGNPVPIQSRAVDPYASYDSSEVNQISRLVTTGKDAILHSTPMIFDISGNTILVLHPGCIVVKDDMTITLQGLNIDFADNDFYVNDSLGHWSEDGNYYVVLEYVYSKSRPAPVASIKIILPSQRTNAAIFNSAAHMLLKVVNVITVSGTRKINVMYDYDPQHTNNFVPKTSNSTVDLTNISNNYTVLIRDTYIISKATVDINITLYSASDCVQELKIINLSPNNSNISINRNGTDTIEGNSQITLINKYDSVSLISDKINTWLEI